jgi:hypothetical protein
MGRGRIWAGWLGCVAGVLWAGAAPAGAQAPPRAPAAALLLPTEGLPLDEMAPPVRERVRQVVQQPTLAAHAPVEVFPCQPELYHWLLDHHDRASLAWRRLGTRCIEITDRGGGRFGWTDGQGSDVVWEEVYRGQRERIWYAQGIVRGGVLLPAVPVRAVAVLRHAETRDEGNRPLMSHQLSLYALADSKAASLAKRLFGASIPRLADQYVVQMELFFSALARHLQRHPDQVEPLLSDAVRLTPSPTGGR